MDIKQINEVLSDLSEYNLKAKYHQALRNEPGDYYDEKMQGETSTCIEVYKLNIDDWHLKIERESDSYGEHESVKSIKFVKPTIKTIETYE